VDMSDMNANGLFGIDNTSFTALLEYRSYQYDASYSKFYIHKQAELMQSVDPRYPCSELIRHYTKVGMKRIFMPGAI
jgi:hypothetical protein